MIQQRLVRIKLGLNRWLESPRSSQGVMVTTFVLLLGASPLKSLIGLPGFLALFAMFVVLSGALLATRHRSIDRYSSPGIALLLLIFWAIVSIGWSEQPLESLWRVSVLIGVTFLGLSIAWQRDTIHIVTGLAAVLRILLFGSLGIEALAVATGPIGVLQVSGHLLNGGPIQGIFGARSVLAFVALVGIITFGVEARIRTVKRPLSFASLATAALCLGLSGSPVTIAAFVVVALGAAALYALRHTSAQMRWRWQVVFVTTGVVALFLTWLLRSWIVVQLDGYAEMSFRVKVWRELSRYLWANPMQGWGFSGPWWNGTPFTWIQGATYPTQSSAMNAFADVYFQLGLVGMSLFALFLVTGLTRSWLLAANRRSVIYVWPALVTLALFVVSLADSFVLSESGWLLLVISATKAAGEMSWRNAWDNRLGRSLPSRAGR